MRLLTLQPEVVKSMVIVAGHCLLPWRIGLEGRYSEALASLLEPSVQQASDSLCFNNLVGMAAASWMVKQNLLLNLMNALSS